MTKPKEVVDPIDRGYDRITVYNGEEYPEPSYLDVRNYDLLSFQWVSPSTLIVGGTMSDGGSVPARSLYSDIATFESEAVISCADVRDWSFLRFRVKSQGSRSQLHAWLGKASQNEKFFKLPTLAALASRRPAGAEGVFTTMMQRYR